MKEGEKQKNHTYSYSTRRLVVRRLTPCVALKKVRRSKGSFPEVFRDRTFSIRIDIRKGSCDSVDDLALRNEGKASIEF